MTNSHSGLTHRRNPAWSPAWKPKKSREIMGSSRLTVHLYPSRSTTRGTPYPTALARSLIGVLVLAATVLTMPRSVAAQYEGSLYGSVSTQSEDHSMWELGYGMAMGSLDVAQRVGMDIRVGGVGHNYFAAGEKVDYYFGIYAAPVLEFNLLGRFGMAQRFRLYLLAGPRLAYLEREMEGLEDDRRFDAGLTSGVGMNVPLGERVSLNVGWEYYLGLFQHEPYGRDTAMMLRFGIRFRGTAAN